MNAHCGRSRLGMGRTMSSPIVHEGKRERYREGRVSCIVGIFRERYVTKHCTASNANMSESILLLYFMPSNITWCVVAACCLLNLEFPLGAFLSRRTSTGPVDYKEKTSSG